MKHCFFIVVIAVATLMQITICHSSVADLFEGAQTGDMDKVEYAFRYSLDIDSTNEEGLTALMLASINGNLEVVKVLMDKGADIDIRSELGNTALIYAAKYGGMEIVEQLLPENDKTTFGGFVRRFFDQSKRFVNVRNHRGESALMCASQRGQLEVVKFLSSRGAAVCVMDINRNTPLMKASMHGHTETVNFLISKGAKVNATNNIGKTSLMNASERGCLDTVKCLISKGADVHAKDYFDSTSLHFASESGSLKVVKYLIEKGARIGIRETGGLKALIASSERGSLAILTCLLSAEHNPEKLDVMRRKALLVASDYGHLKIVRYLVSLGVDVNTGDRNGCTPLILASRRNSYEESRLENLKLERGRIKALRAMNAYGGYHVPGMSSSLAVRSAMVENLLDRKSEVGASGVMNEIRLFGEPNIRHKRRSLESRMKNDSVVQNILADYAYQYMDAQESLLYIVSKQERMDIVNYLLVKGADINAKDNRGWTALAYAVKDGNCDIIKYLLRHGGEVTDTVHQVAMKYADGGKCLSLFDNDWKSD